jgi:predicted Zn-ribbon and HTH transcriptional regulator
MLRRADDPACCANCGYALTGLTEPRCPECGTAIEVNQDEK